MAAAIAPVTGEMTIDIPECPACGGSHNVIVARPFKANRLPYTHWYNCPTVFDPVSLTLAMQGDNPIEVNRRIIQDLAEAQANGGCLMFVTFGTDKRAGVTLRRHTSDFPTNRMEEAVRLLYENLTPEMPLPAPRGPLPKADLQSILARSVTAAAARNGAGQQDEDQESDEPDSEEQ